MCLDEFLSGVQQKVWEKWPKTEVAKSQEVVCPTLTKSSQHQCVMVCADAGAHMQLNAMEKVEYKAT